MMVNDYISVTEIAGDEVTQEQVDRMCNRYYWAGQYCADKDVVEVACGSGQGLGYLSGIAKSLEAGDYSDEILSIARQHYGERIASYDAKALAHATLEMIENREEAVAMAKAGQEIVQKKFVWQKTAAEYEKLFMEGTRRR